MKKILLLLVLLFSSIVSAQEIGEYEFYLEGWLYGDTHHHCGLAEIDFFLKKETGNEERINFFRATYYEDSPAEFFGRDRSTGITETKKRFKADKKITSIFFSSSRRTRKSCKGPRPHRDGSTNKNLNTTCYKLDFTFDDFDNIDRDGSGLWNSQFTMYIEPVLHVIDPQESSVYLNQSKILPTEDRVKILSHTGFRKDEYYWQYSLNSVDYFDLPQYNGQSELLVNARDILGSDVEKYIGKNVSFRQVLICNNKIIRSNVVTYRILESAPKVTTEGTPVKTTCYDSADGQIRLYFDRPIAQDEHINFSVQNLSTDSPVDNKFDKIKTLEADNSFNLTGLPIGDYSVIITGKKNGLPTYSSTQDKPIKFTIDRYDPVDFTLAKTDVWCYEGTDGEIHITATGGTEQGYWYKVEGSATIDWTPFENVKSKVHTIKGLKKGTYKIQVRDSNLCISKEQAKDPNGNTVLGKEKVLPMVLIAPKDSLNLEYTLVHEPRFYGATNGKIIAKIDGGTIKDDNSYDFTWVNSKGQQVGKIQTEYVSGSFYITLDGIGSDLYYLTIQDKNYNDSKDKVNCTIVQSKVDLPQPDPLKASITVIKPISCHVSNEFGDETDVNPLDGQRDESQDGHLQIIAEGGRPFTGNENGGYPYKFTWKRLMPDQTWKVYDEKSSKLDLLSDGTYAINIMDRYGIVIGVYQNNELVKETDVVYKFDQPKQLKLSFTGKDATCHGADGQIEALVSGGTPPYTYKWSNGETTASIKQLESMPYFVTVNDARGCLVQGSYTVNQPDDVVITEHIKPLLCYNAQDAEIEVFVKGGTLPYSYEWNTKATTSKISNLPWGTYQVKVTDAQGCSFIKTYKIDNPQEILLHLDQQRTLCNDQVLDLDITLKDDPGAVYLWESTTGFTSKLPKVSLASEGVYFATVITSNGCIIKDQIEIKRSYAAIGSEFFISTQAYTDEEVILVNVSRPIGQTSEWIVPKEVEVLKQTKEYLTVRFAKEGKYDIKLLQTQGDCYKEYTKEIIVEKNSGFNTKDNSNQASSVEEFIVTPNPNNGVFEVFVQLSKESPINIRMFNALGQKVLMDKQSPSSRVHRVQYQENLAGGIYIIVVETPTQTLSKRIVIR